ncbi:MAG TPA: hypothetical protein VGO96_07545 [Pyrinomonadaceae bacterium]|jgi:CheY-like chemotaxis protein|nr:hypothetical protein [Pyrinomonadaceae bacterium]
MAQAGAAAARATILIADNDAEWLRLQKEAFLSEGFNVLTAEGPSEVEMVLSSGDVDAVVLDIRLENDDDDKDVSGLSLVEKTAPEVGKVITTKYPIDMTTGQTFKSSIKHKSPFVRYVDKREGIPAIVAAAKKVVGVSFISRHGWEEIMAARLTLARRRQFTLLVLPLLLLALGAGVMAVYTANLQWLIGTIVLAVVSLFTMRNSI